MLASTNPWRTRLKAAGIHLCISLALAVVAALVVFWIWYPYPYREISGGRALFFLIVTVDVILGPLLTLAVFNPKKDPKELVRDLSVIGMLQLVALIYGMWTVAVARPVHLVFEMDRFRVVHAIDVPTEQLEKALPALRRLPWTGPTLLSVRPFRNEKEKVDATVAEMQGAPVVARPDFWQEYEKARPQILASVKPLSELKRRFPARSAEIDETIKSSASGRSTGSLVYLPMLGRDTFWTVLLDPTTLEVIAFVPVDPL